MELFGKVRPADSEVIAHRTDSGEPLSKTISVAITPRHAKNFVQPDFFVQLSLSGAKLRGNDMFAKSDPMAVVYTCKIDGTLEEIGRTEVIKNTLDPSWIGKVSLRYQFEMVQPLVGDVNGFCTINILKSPSMHVNGFCTINILKSPSMH